MTRLRWLITVGLAAPVLPALLGAGCRTAPRPRNLLLITLDTMRADRLPPYGFTGVATPTLDRLAAEGVVFEAASAAVPLTLPSHATLFTGLYPPRLGIRDNAGAPLAAGFTTLAEVLHERGLATAAFVASGVLAKGRGLEQGFTSYREGPQAPCAGTPHARRRADAVVDDVVGWLDRRDSTPFFVWMHLYDTHRPYGLPDDYLRSYADLYLAAIAFEDAEIARAIGALENRHLLDDTLVVVAGDHGESLGAHGEESHGIFVYQDTLHVPLIMRGPGIAPRRVRAVTRLVDVMPTILDLFGVKAAGVDGVSLTGLIAGTSPDPRLEVYAESQYPRRFGWAPLRALRADRYKVIEAPRPELYDLVADPGETRNLISDRPRIAAAMLGRLRAFDDHREPASGQAAPIDRAVAERIASLGYVAGASARMTGTSTTGADPKDGIAAFNRMTRIQWQTAALTRGQPSPCGRTVTSGDR